MYNQELILQLENLIAPYLEKQNIDLVDLTLSKIKKQLLVRILADKFGGGITIEECADINRHIGDLIDKTNIIDSSYMLEVSSPGLDRPLSTIKDFNRAVNKKIKLFVQRDQGKIYEITGTLVSTSKDSIDVALDEKQVTIALENIKKARQVI